jgi:hypothetical protein
MDCVGSADRVGSGLGQTDVANFAFRDQLSENADRLFDGGVRIDAVLVVQVDVVGAKPPEGALKRRADVGWTAVKVP